MLWLEEYKAKLVSSAEAVQCIQSGNRVYVHPGACTPNTLLQAMTARSDELLDVEVTHILTFGNADYAFEKYKDSFHHRALFVGANVRKAVRSGNAQYVPIFLGEIPKLFRSGECDIDVSLISVSPPDEYGFCTFGAGVDITKAACEVAKIIVAEVNPNQPRSLGDSFIHLNKIDHLVEVDTPLPEYRNEKMTDVHEKIGEFCADMIEDGSTLQMGIGAIPDAVLHHLTDKKDMGIHTEMFSDGLLGLVEAGIITNEKKTLHKGKSIAAFALGTKRLFDFINNNPLFEFHPCEYTNDPFVIAQNEKMIAINSAIEVDFTGQICSDSVGLEIYSGFGGQVDFIRGSARSKGGKPIIALPSTAKNGEISRIVSKLRHGAGVVTTRADIHYVITEYGVAYLFGKTLEERVKAMIGISHPDFREYLTEEARKYGYLV